MSRMASYILDPPNLGLWYSYGVDYGALRRIYFLDLSRGLWHGLRTRLEVQPNLASNKEGRISEQAC